MSTPSDFNKEQLLSYIERIETKNDEIASCNADIKEICNEAKSAGYDPKYIKQMVRLRKKDKDEIDEEDELLAMYRKVLGL